MHLDYLRIQRAGETGEAEQGCRTWHCAYCDRDGALVEGHGDVLEPRATTRCETPKSIGRRPQRHRDLLSNTCWCPASLVPYTHLCSNRGGLTRERLRLISCFRTFLLVAPGMVLAWPWPCRDKNQQKKVTLNTYKLKRLFATFLELSPVGMAADQSPMKSSVREWM